MTNNSKRVRIIIWSVFALYIIGGMILGKFMRPIPPCPTMVSMSRTCIPFGCTHTYINARGEDTGECE